MSEKKQGTLTVVAKTGGIRFQGEDVWYNPDAVTKKYVKPDMKGKEVEITLKEGTENNFTFIKVLNGETTTTVKNTGIPGKITDNRNILIIRQTCIKATATLLQGKSPSMEWFFLVAEDMEKWILTGNKPKIS